MLPELRQQLFRVIIPHGIRVRPRPAAPESPGRSSTSVSQSGQFGLFRAGPFVSRRPLPPGSVPVAAPSRTLRLFGRRPSLSIARPPSPHGTRINCISPALGGVTGISLKCPLKIRGVTAAI